MVFYGDTTKEVINIDTATETSSQWIQVKTETCCSLRLYLSAFWLVGNWGSVSIILMTFPVLTKLLGPVQRQAANDY